MVRIIPPSGAFTCRQVSAREHLINGNVALRGNGSACRLLCLPRVPPRFYRYLLKGHKALGGLSWDNDESVQSSTNIKR